MGCDHRVLEITDLIIPREDGRLDQHDRTARDHGSGR